jgi:protein SCO1/2
MVEVAAAQTAAPDRAAMGAGNMGMAMDMAMDASYGGDVDPNGVKIDFALLDRAGRTVTDEDFRGKFLLLTFGFTHCEHICPMMAFNMGQVLKAAHRPAAGVFISVDTERDTPASNDNFARAFDDSMMGLGGSYQQINAAAENFRISYAVTKTQHSYTVQHTAKLYLVDPQGKLVDVFAMTTPPAVILQAVQQWPSASQ